MEAISEAHSEEPSVNPPLVSLIGPSKQSSVNSDHGNGRNGITKARVAVLMSDNSGDVITLGKEMHPPRLTVAD
jgi:hypothetical protein